MSPRHNPPPGDAGLTGGRSGEQPVIADGGAGPDPTSATTRGQLGGLGNTSDGVASRDPRGEDDSGAGLSAEAETAQTTLADVIGPGQSDLDGSALD